MTDEHEVHTLAAPYALHALPVDEVEPFERHLRQCPTCREEVADIREVAARLGAAEGVTPPPDLKRRVLAEVAGIRPLPPLVDETDGAAPGPEPHPAWRRWWPRLSAAAAAVLLVVTGVLGVMLNDATQDRDDGSRLSAEIERVASAPDMRQGTDRSAGGSAVVMSSRSRDAAVVLPSEMDPVPEGRVYQAWFINGGDIRSAGLLRTKDGDAAPLTADGLGEAAQVGITMEPEGGSDQPTTDPVLLVDLPT